MKDEVILAAVLLAAACLLLILTIIMLCIVFKTVKYKSSSDGATSEIPTSKTRHQYDNYAQERDTSVGFYGDTTTNKDTTVSYYGNETGDDHKSEWPKSYNMYAISRSYAFPKAGEQSNEPEVKPKAASQPSSQPSSIAASSTREAHHKTFSEEVFEGINYANATTLPRETEPASQDSGRGIWKSRTPSETASQHSHDTGSVQGSTVSQSRVVRERSYYSSFKPRHNGSVSSASTSQVTEISNGRNSGSTRERMATHSVKSSGSQKVFTFNLE